MCILKSLDYLKGTIGRNMDIKGDFPESSERSQESSRESIYQLRGYLYGYHEQNVDRNINSTVASCESSDGNVIGL